jgi:hypothetical protein
MPGTSGPGHQHQPNPDTNRGSHVGADPSVTVFVPYDNYTPVNDYVMLLEDDGDYLCQAPHRGGVRRAPDDVAVNRHAAASS